MPSEHILTIYFKSWFKLGVCAVRLARFFLKIVTEPIGISFLIIKTDSYRLRSVFQPIVVRFGWLSLIGLVGLKR